MPNDRKIFRNQATRLILDRMVLFRGCSNLKLRFFREAAMQKFLLMIAAIVMSGFASSCLTPAFALPVRTWVSGTGADSNDCSRASPCQTFAGAFSKTAPGGEINCLDSGDFGGVTISNAIAIICDNVEAGVLVSGTNGITVNAGASDVVILSGLDIRGNDTGLIGISYLAGKSLSVSNSAISAFAGVGISFAPSAGTNKLEVSHTIVENNGGTGILVKPSGSGVAQAAITDVLVSKNGGDGISSIGTATSGYVSVFAKSANAIQNAASGFVAFSSGAQAVMMVSDSSAFRNNNGLATNGTGAILRFGSTIVTNNNTGVKQVGAGSTLSYGNNNVNGNTTDGTFGAVTLQ
jgi:hypothetical protein